MRGKEKKHLADERTQFSGEKTFYNFYFIKIKLKKIKKLGKKVFAGLKNTGRK